MHDVRNVDLEQIDRRLVEETQSGLPVTARPYHTIAEKLEVDPVIVMQQLDKLQRQGIIRRIGVVPNHYKLGYRANGMSVWDVPDDMIIELGNTVGKLEFVSHCYHRPRHLPDWPYNLFAMVHGRDRETTNKYVEQIATILGDANKQHTVLYSTRILKKTGMRIGNTK